MLRDFLQKNIESLQKDLAENQEEIERHQGDKTGLKMTVRKVLNVNSLLM